MNDRLAYVATPTVLGSRVLFASAGQLWETTLEGGLAKLFLGGDLAKSRPAFSPDGSRVSFSQAAAGGSEIFLCDDRAEQVERMTFLGSVSRNLGWRGDEIIFASQARLPYQSALWLYRLRETDREPQLLPWGPASQAAFHVDGTCILARHEMTETITRKRYRGGAAGELWIDHNGDGQFRQLLALSGNLSRPCWVGDRIYFLSDHEGVGNIYSCLRNGSHLQRHTEHHDFYARALASDGKTLVYVSGGDLFKLIPGEPRPERIPVLLPAVDDKAIEVEPGKFTEDFAAGPGERVAVAARGHLITTSKENSAPVITPRRGRVTRVSYLGETLACLASDGIQETLELHSNGVTEFSLPAIGRCVAIKPSPASKKWMALSTDHQELHLFDLETGLSSLIAKSPHAEILNFDWSADGERLAYCLPVSPTRTTLHLWSKTTPAAISLTLDVPITKISQAVFLSDNSLVFLGEDLSNRASVSQYEADAPVLRIYRVRPNQAVEVLPLPAAKYLRLVALGESFAVSKLTHDLASAEAQDLLHYDLAASRETLIARGVSAFRGAPSGLVFRSRQQFFHSDCSVTPIETKLAFDMTELRLQIHPRNEYRQIFRETWKGQADHFWQNEMAGLDWVEIGRRYEGLLDRISTRAELTDLLWELFGELGTSHAYVGNRSSELPAAPGFLGARFKLDERHGDYQIESIPRDEVWDPSTSSPLAHPVLPALEGARLVSINGEKVSGTRPPSSLLAPATTVSLRFVDLKGRETDFNVKPLTSESALQYRSFLRRSLQQVKEQTGGRCGYIQIPNTHAQGYTQFTRQYLLHCDLDALILDVRYSTGGNQAAAVLDRLARQPLARVSSRWSASQTFPPTTPPQVLVLLVNEYTGSDSEVFAHGFRQRKLGPIIGTRTWGGVFGYKSRFLSVDQGYSTRPQTAFSLTGEGFAVENRGILPDLIVEMRPQDYAQSTDRQLEAATLEVVRRLDHEAK